MQLIFDKDNMTFSLTFEHNCSICLIRLIKTIYLDQYLIDKQLYFPNGPIILFNCSLYRFGVIPVIHISVSCVNLNK